MIKIENYKLWCKNRNQWERDNWCIMPDGVIWDLGHDIPMNEKTHILVHGSGLIIENNKELFEGDVYKKNGYVYIVEYSQIDGFYQRLIYDDWLGWNVYKKNQRSWLHMTDYDAKKCELIGNIFEKPELLDYEGDE